jgi:hypothetical protein
MFNHSTTRPPRRRGVLATGALALGLLTACGGATTSQPAAGSSRQPGGKPATASSNGPGCPQLTTDSTGAAVHLVIDSGSVTCEEARKVFTDYKAAGPGQGSAGIVTVDGWTCARNSIAGITQTGTLASCAQDGQRAAFEERKIGTGGGATASGDLTGSAQSTQPPSAPSPAPTAPPQSSGSTAAFCKDLFSGPETPLDLDFLLTPEGIALANRLDADAPAGVKSDMDTLVFGLRQMANEPATPSFYSAYGNVLTWVHDNCGFN